MANTGYRIYPRLKKVTTDGTEQPLDVNNRLCSLSGLPQDTMNNPDVNVGKVRDGACLPYSYTRSGDFQKNNCSPSNWTGGFVTYEKIFYSSVSVEDAQAAAAVYGPFNAEGQANANVLGVCYPPLAGDAVGIIVVDIYDQPNIDVVGYVDTADTIPYQDPVSTQVNFLPNDGTAAANCWALASDLVSASGSLKWRIEFNVARLINAYPSKTDFIFKVQARGNVVGQINGAYSLKGADAGKMKMNGSEGTYVPTVESANTIGLQNFYGKNYPAGKDGNFNIRSGGDVLIFTYNVANKQLILT